MRRTGGVKYRDPLLMGRRGPGLTAKAAESRARNAKANRKAQLLEVSAFFNELPKRRQFGKINDIWRAGAEATGLSVVTVERVAREVKINFSNTFFCLEAKETEIHRQITPTVKYQNPSAWNHESTLHAFSNAPIRENSQ